MLYSILQSSQKHISELIIELWVKDFRMNKDSFLPYKDILSLIDKIDNILLQYEGKNDDTNSYCINCLTTAESTNSVSTYYPLITYGSNSSTKSAPLSSKKIIHTLLKNNPFIQDSKASLQVINYMIMENYDSLSDRRDKIGRAHV